MIVISENHGSSVSVYGRVSAADNGRSPIDFLTGVRNTEDGIRELGYERVSEWQRSEYGTEWAKVRKLPKP